MGVNIPSPFLRKFTGAPQAIVAGALITVAHGLGLKPFKTEYAYRVVTAFGNWNIGDILEDIDGFYIGGGSLNHFAQSDATNLYFNGAGGGILFFNRTTGAPILAPTVAHVNLIPIAWY